MLVYLNTIAYLYRKISYMTSEKAKIGRVVCLKSGGLPMTIEYKPDDYTVKCVWFDYNNMLNRGEFKVNHVKKCKPRKF
jgi:uncharacterized protein YodC (DUF2158 family)